MLIEPKEHSGRASIEIERVTALMIRATRSRRERPPFEAVGAVERPLVRHGPESTHDPDLDTHRMSHLLHSQEGCSRTDLNRLPFETYEPEAEGAATLVPDSLSGRHPIGCDAVRTPNRTPTTPMRTCLDAERNQETERNKQN